MQHRTIWRKLLIAGIVANVLVVLVIVFDTRATEAPLTWKSYESRKFGYSVSYPSNWRISELERREIETETRFSLNEDVYFSTVNSVKAAIQANLFRNKQERLDEPLLTVCHNTAMADLPSKFRGFKPIETTEMKAGNSTEAIGTTFEFTARKGFSVRRMSGMIVSVWNADKHVGLLFVCPKREYDKYRPMYQSFLDSYKTGRPLIGGAGAAPELSP